MDISQFVYSPVDGHLDCFHCPCIMNNCAMNTCVQVVMWTYVFHSLEDIGMELLGGSYVTLCLPFEELTDRSQSRCTILHSCQQCMKVSVSPCPHQWLLLSF